MLKHVQDVMTMADTWVGKGATVYFKFTCVACGNRQGFDEPNTLFATGSCEDCGHTTDLMNDARANVNFLMHIDTARFQP